MPSRRHILALLVALLWLAGGAPTGPIADAQERVVQAADVDALPARRVENPRILCPSKRADTSGTLPEPLGAPSALVQIIEQGGSSKHGWHPAKTISSGTARGPPLWS